MDTKRVNFPKRKHLCPEKNGIPVKTGLICPVCSDGELEIKVENVKRVEYDNYNKKICSKEDWDGEDLQFGFHGILVCTDCHEEIVFAGKYNPEYAVESTAGNPDQTWREVLTVEYIERPPHILRFDAKFSTQIQDILLDSYKLYWIDFESCANRLGDCLEWVMELHGVSRQSFGKDCLRDCIPIFLKRNPELNEILSNSGVQWIYRTPHHTDKITESNLCAGYMLLDSLLTWSTEKLKGHLNRT